MYCWGSSENGELGLGGLTVEKVLLPTFNNLGVLGNIREIACGLTHTLLLTQEGHVYSCGSNERGQLGHIKTTQIPELINSLDGLCFVSVAAGDQHSLALSSCGTVYSWGENGFGQLGINSSESQLDFPRLIKALAKKHVIQVTCGANHTLALTQDNELYAWGDNNSGQLGLGHKESPVVEPQIIKILSPIPLTLIAAGGQHSAALTRAGFLLTWGSNKYGQLGRPSDNNINVCTMPMLVPNLATYSEPICYLALGENHSAVLDSYGKLWTFGQGRYGQLGHGNFEDSSVPRPVLDLFGSKICQVACGRSHTLVYIPSQVQICAIGLGMSGQLGVDSCHNQNLPQCVIGPWRSPNEKNIDQLSEFSRDNQSTYIKRVYAGGDSSFVSISNEIPLELDFCTTCPFEQPLIIEESKIDAMLSLSEEDLVDDELFTYCETVFGSLGCWNASFIKSGSSKLDHCLDYSLMEDCINKLRKVRKESLNEIAVLGIQKAIKDLPSHSPSPEALRGLIIIPHWKGFSNLKNAKVFQKPFAKAFLELSSNLLSIFRKWLHSLPIDYARLLVHSYKTVVAYIIISQKNFLHAKPLSQTIAEEREFLLSSLKILDFLHKENKTVHGTNVKIPYEEFYIPEITDNVDIRQDYYYWLSTSRNGNETNRLCFCEYSFLFNSQAKTLLLRADATKQMQGAIDEAFQQANPLVWFLNPNEMQFLTFHVHRDNLVRDTLAHLDRCHINELKKPLKIHFIGEEAEDAGGVRKEFFLLLMQALLNPDYGMFTEFHNTNIIWFRESDFEVWEIYALVGVVCGLAIYNFTIINLPFPLALYKKLLDEPVDIDDLAEMDPSLVRNLKMLLEYEGDDVEDVFGLNFTITQDYFGESKVIPLTNLGETIPVTSSNKLEYVQALVNWKLNEGIAKQYQAFHTGFHRVCGGGVLKLFQPIELMALVTGNENYDWKEFQANTTYKGCYDAEHPVIKYFWEVFGDLSKEQKKLFLKFLTGCDRIPILGMKAIKMVIESTGDMNYLPVAHTCVCQLDLPQYSTKEKLRYKLLQAIQQSEGFGLV